MDYRAIIQKKSDWRIGWLIDLPGVNAQGKTRKRMVESLQIGAREMLALNARRPAVASLPESERLT